MGVLLSRKHIAAKLSGAALPLALLAMLASSLVAAPAQASPRPGAPTPAVGSASAAHAPQGSAAWLAQQRTRMGTPQALAAARAKIAKLPKWKPNARIVTSRGTTPVAAHNTLSPHLAVPVATDPNNWTSLGPGPVNVGGMLETGAVTDIAASATNPNDLWIVGGWNTGGSLSYGSVWHSADGGATWTTTTNALQSQYLQYGGGQVVVDPTNDQTIFLSNGYGYGLLESTDGGATWQGTAAALASVTVNKVTISATNDQYMLAAGFGALVGGVWYSNDHGVTWTQTLTDNAVSFDMGTDVLFDPAHPGVAYAAIGENTSSAGGVYRSTDYGATWSLLAGGPAGTSVGLVSLALSHDGARLYVSAGDVTTTSLLNTSIYVFDTTNSTWTSHNLSATAVSADPGDWNINNVIGVSPADSTDNTVYLGSNNLYGSTDGGVTWAQISTGTVGAPMTAMVFPSVSSGDFVAATGLGVWSYMPGAATPWTNDNATLAIGFVYGMTYGDQGSYSSLLSSSGLVPSFGYGGGIAQYPAGSTGSATWSPVMDPHASGGVTLDWSNNANVYTSYLDCSSSPCVSQVYKSTSGGAGPYSLTALSTTDWGIGLPPVISQVHPQTLFLGTTHLWETTNGGATWNTISPQLDTTPPGGGTCAGPSDTNCPFISQVVVAPSTDSTILVQYSSGATFATMDGGASWHSVAPVCAPQVNCANLIVEQYAINPSNPQMIYASGIFNGQASAVVPHSGCGPFCVYGAPALFVSTNGGNSWSLLSAVSALPQTGGTSFAISPANPNLIVLYTDMGAFISSDGGLDWMSIPSIPAYSFGDDGSRRVLFSHDGSQLLIGTQGLGILAIAMPHLTLSQQAVTLTTATGSSPANQTVTLGNSGQGTLSWSTSGLPSWLSVSPSSGALAPGATQQVTLSFNTPSMTPQTYSTELTFAGNADNANIALPVTVSSRLSKTWYFAEGYTGTGFTEYLTLANSNPVAANVTVQYLLQGSAPLSKVYNVNANARRTLNVNTEVGQPIGVSLVVTSDQPIVAERPMYFTFTGLGLHVPGGTDTLGATSLGTQYDFGYLDTTANHATYLTVLNPNSSAMTVTVNYYAAAGGSPTVIQHTVAANARGTITVNTDVPPGSYSALVSLSSPGLVERPLYLTDTTTGYTGSADVIGVQSPATNWSFAEGFTNPNFAERYLLSNPGNSSATATVTFLKSDGTHATANVTLAAGAQQVVNANSVLGNGVNNSAVVTSSAPILAERFMSFTYHGPVGTVSSSSIPGATDVLGATSVGHVYDFAEGYTGGAFGEYLTLQNPQNTTTQVTVVYLPQNGGAPTTATYFVAAHSRYTVLTNTVMPNQSFSMVVLGSAPIVAERPMYFNYNGDTGGSDVVGYQP